MSVMRKKSIFYNMLSQLVMQVVVFVVGLIVPRYILLHYGSEINGISNTVNQIISYAALLEAGLGLASIQALYKPLAANDIDGINGICAATKKYYYQITAWMSLVIVIAAVVYAALAKGSTDKGTVAMLVLVISSTSIIDHAFHAKYNVILTADQKLYVVSFAKILGLLFQAAVKLILIYMRVHIVLVYAASSLALVIRIPLIALYVKKKYPKLSFKGEMNLSALKQRSALLIHQLAGLVVNNSGAIIVSITSKDGLKLASVYAVYRLVYKNMYNLITGAFSNGSVASFGQLFASGHFEAAKKAFRNFEVLYYIVIGVLYGCVAALILPFVGLYTDGVTDIEYILPAFAVLMTIGGVLNCTRVPCGMLINACGHFHQTKYRALLEAVINFVVTLVLIFKYDIYAIAIASIISYVYRVTDIIIYSNRAILKDKAWGSLRSILISWLGVFLTWLVVQGILPGIETWASFFGMAFVTMLISLALVLCIAFALKPKDAKAVLWQVKNKITTKTRKA